MKLNEKIAYYRRSARLSQEELAAQVGVSRQAVSKWELGESTPEVNKLMALARAFGITTDELLSDSDPAQAREQFPPPPEKPQAAPAPVAEDSFDKATGLVGRLIRKYGWLLGVRVALSGLGLILVGVLARWGFGSVFHTANGMMDDFVSIGGMGGVTFSPGTPPELQQEILNQMGLGASASASPFGGMENFFLGFATVILAVGVVIAIAGAVLAVVLYQKGNRKP